MSDSSIAGGRKFFGHPWGLSTLFFTEMWERLSYYGMRALLTVYMTDTTRGGLAMGVETSGAVYGLYTFGVYALTLPGGWIADRLIGKRKSVLYGGIVIAIGHYVLAIPYVVEGSELWSYYLGLILVVVGTGLLKPNVSAIVGDLYSKNDPARRDAGFSIFYMGINIGAFAGPLLCSYLGEQVDWHLGFSVAGVGMTFGVIQYMLGQRHLEGCGELAEESAQPDRLAAGWRSFYIGLVLFVAACAGCYWLVSSGTMGLIRFADSLGLVTVVISLLYFAAIIAFVCRNTTERKRVFVIFMLFIGAAMFWSGFEQAGSSMTLFAEDSTDRTIGSWVVPTGWLQSINPLFIILCAPIMGMLWVWLQARNPSIPVKFGAGLALLGAGFLVLAWGATYIPDGSKGNPAVGVSMVWLTVTYFFHTIGELCLSPVGLSSVTKLSPDRLVGQMMGTWFMGAALGNLIAGLIAARIEARPLPELFGIVAAIAIGSGVIFFLMSPWLKKMTDGIN